MEYEDGNLEMKARDGTKPKLLEKHDYWATGRGSSNWIARISGEDKTYKLKRDFLEKGRDGRKMFFRMSDFEIGAFYHVGSRRRWEENFHPVEETSINAYFVCDQVTPEGVVLKPIDQREIIQAVQDDNTIEMKAAESYIKSAVKSVGKAKVLEILAGIK